MGETNHSKNHRNQYKIATGITAVREITIEGEFIMEGAWFAQGVMGWIPIEVGSLSSNREIESY